jgi:hypothetical protein
VTTQLSTPAAPARATKPDARDWIDTAIEWASGLAAVGMFAYGVALSYAVLHAIAAAAGLPAWAAGVWPLGFEAFMAAAALNALAEQRHRRHQPDRWARVAWYPWTLTGLTAGASIALNWCHPAIPLAPPPGWLVSVVYGLPPLIAVLAWHLFLGRVTHRHPPTPPAVVLAVPVPTATVPKPSVPKPDRDDPAGTAPAGRPRPASARPVPHPRPARPPAPSPPRGRGRGRRAAGPGPDGRGPLPGRPGPPDRPGRAAPGVAGQQPDRQRPAPRPARPNPDPAGRRARPGPGWSRPGPGHRPPTSHHSRPGHQPPGRRDGPGQRAPGPPGHRDQPGPDPPRPPGRQRGGGQRCVTPTATPAVPPRVEVGCCCW